MPYHGSPRVLRMIHPTLFHSTKRHERAYSFSCCGKKREKSAEKVDRTPDLMIFSHTLSQLSYLGSCFCLFSSLDESDPLWALFPLSAGLSYTQEEASMGDGM